MEGFCAPLRAQGWEIYNFNNISLYWIYHANNWGRNIIWIVDISPIWVNISHIYPSFAYISVPQTEILPIYCPQVSFWSPYTKYFAKIQHLWGVLFPQKSQYIRPSPIYPSPKLIYCLYIVHKSVFEVLIPSTLQKYSIYGMYCSLKKVNISPIYPPHQQIYCLYIV